MSGEKLDRNIELSHRTGKPFSRKTVYLFGNGIFGILISFIYWSLYTFNGYVFFSWSDCNHCGFNTPLLAFFLVLLSAACGFALWKTRKLGDFPIKKPFIWTLAILSLAASLNLFLFDYFHIMMYYDEWAEVGMPDPPAFMINYYQHKNPVWGANYHYAFWLPMVFILAMLILKLFSKLRANPKR